MSRTRLNIFLAREHAKRLDEVAVTKGVSKSGVVAAALTAYLMPDGATNREAIILRRLDKLSRQHERLERDQTILIETLSLFIRYQFSVSTPIPEPHQEAARAQGRARFQIFVEQLGRHLQRGHSLVRDVSEEIAPDSPHPPAMTDGVAHETPGQVQG